LPKGGSFIEGIASAGARDEDENGRLYETARYFVEEVLRKRPYLRLEWCIAVIENPVRRELQADGRIRFWGYVPDFGGRALRVVTLGDGLTIHNAFPDRDFRRQEP
jgi:hypothetical protein